MYNIRVRTGGGAAVNHYWIDDSQLATDPGDGLGPRSGELSAEIRLLWGVLACAVGDLQAGDQGAAAWFASDETGQAATGFNFVDLCVALDLEPDAVRTMIARLPRRTHRRTAPHCAKRAPRAA